jgi:hypothetical protein
MSTRLSDWIKSAPVGKTSAYELLAVLGIKPDKVRSRGVSAAVSVLSDSQAQAMDRAAQAVAAGTPIAQVAVLAPAVAPGLEEIERQVMVVLDLVRAALTNPPINSPAPAQLEQVLPPGKMKKSMLDRIIGSQYEDWISNRGRYNVKEFRQHCEPLLRKHFCHEDLGPDCDGLPRWYGRFSYAHKDIAGQYDYIHESGGIYVMCSC